MPKWFSSLLCAGALLAPSVFAQTSPEGQRAAVAWIQVFGEIPATAAIEQTAKGGSIPAIAAALRQQLGRNEAAAREVAERAWADTFGPSRPFETGESSGPVSYLELVGAHLESLQTAPQNRRALIDAAYTAVLGRQAYDIEHDYWLGRPPIPFLLVTACLDDWARRNQPGLMATAGPPCIPVDSRRIRTLRLAPAIATEARALLHGDASDGALALARGESVLAPGAAGIISVGGIPFLAVSRNN